MKLEEIKAEWDGDSKVDGSELGNESLRTPELHNKYYKMMMTEGQTLRSISAKYKTLYRQKWEYYLGILDHETLKAKNWQPWALKVLRTDVPTYLEADTELQNEQEKFDFQKEKFNYIESILKVIHNRGFTIKNAIDWEKFKNGQ